MADYPTFCEFLAQKVGRKWVLAPRLTGTLRRKGHEVALSECRYQQLEAEWADGHPAFGLLSTLPNTDLADWVKAQVRLALRNGSTPPSYQAPR